MFSDRINRLSPSSTMAMDAKAREMIANKIDVIRLGVGDPALDPSYEIPEGVEKSILDTLKKKRVGYAQSAGILELRQALVDKMREEFNLKYDPSNVVITVGAKQAIFNAFLATINKDDEVILPAPFWVSYKDVAELFGAKVIIVKTNAKNGFKITPSELENAITPKTKWVLLNSPNNPTGHLYSEQELKNLAHVLHSNPNVHVMSDDIYDHLIFDPSAKFCNIVMADSKMKDRTLIINGFSKSYGMTGWRVGYAVGGREMIKKLEIAQSQSVSGVSVINQLAALEALKKDHTTAKNLTRHTAERLELVKDALKNTKMTTINPQGAFYVFVGIGYFIDKKFENHPIKSDDDFCRLLLTEFKVSTVPGSAFGMKDHLRISLCVSQEEIKKAIQRMVDFCSKIS